MSKRHHRVHQSDGENGVHAVFDDVILAPASKENDERRERKNRQQFNGHISDLSCTRGAEGVKLTHVVIRSNVHGKSDGGDEHAGHSGHASPLFGHQRTKAVAFAKFVFNLRKPLRDLALPFGCVSIAHGRANLPFHISLAFEKSVKSKGKSL